MPVLAIDQGTSGTKAILLDPSGAILAIAEVPVFPTHGPRGEVEQDPAELFASVLSAGRAALAQVDVRPRAVALANQGETVLAWDRRTGEPLTAAISWQDRRAETVCADLAEHAEEVHRRTGLVLDPYFSAPKMRWLRDNFTSRGVVTTTDAWILHRLTGEFVTDTSTASRSMLLDVETAGWDDWLVDLFNLTEQDLPRLVASDEIVGSTTAFGWDLPVAGLMVDQQAALLAQRCLEPGSAKCTYGTGAFLLVNVGDRAPRVRNGLTTSVAWTLRGTTTYCVDGQAFTAASAVQWLQRMGLIKDAASLDGVTAATSADVLCGPAFAGLAAPWWRPDAKAFIAGMDLSTTPGEVVRAVLEGISAQVTEIADLVTTDLGLTLPVLRVDGGLTRSDVLMQSQANILQASVEVFPSGHATALGVGAAARLALDPELTLSEATSLWTPGTTYHPAWDVKQAEHFRDRWRRATAANLEGVSL